MGIIRRMATTGKVEISEEVRNDLFAFDRFHYGEQQYTKVNGDKSRSNPIKISARLQ